jgi:hypothetical protein
MKQAVILFTLLCLTAGFANAQDVYTSSGKPVRKAQKKEEKPTFGQRLVYGGGFALGFGTITNIGASPVIGYRFTNKFLAGIGMGYQYLRVKDYYPLTDPASGKTVYRPFISHIYSPSIWARYIVWRNIFVHTEYEHNFMSYRHWFNNTGNTPPTIEYISEKISVPSLLVGGGVRQPVTDRVSLVLVALYDVIQDPNSPYRGTLSIRFGINAGF